MPPFPGNNERESGASLAGGFYLPLSPPPTNAAGSIDSRPVLCILPFSSSPAPSGTHARRAGSLSSSPLLHPKQFLSVDVPPSTRFPSRAPRFLRNPLASPDTTLPPRPFDYLPHRKVQHVRASTSNASSRPCPSPTCDYFRSRLTDRSLLPSLLFSGVSLLWGLLLSIHPRNISPIFLDYRYTGCHRGQSLGQT